MRTVAHESVKTGPYDSVKEISQKKTLSGRKSTADGDRIMNIEETIGTIQTVNETELEEVLKLSNLDITEKRAIHRVTKDWNSKIDEKFSTSNNFNSLDTVTAAKKK